MYAVQLRNVWPPCISQLCGATMSSEDGCKCQERMIRYPIFLTDIGEVFGALIH